MARQAGVYSLVWLALVVSSCSGEGDDLIGAVSQEAELTVQLRNQLSGVCLDVVGAPGSAPGTVLQTYPCEANGRDAWGGPSDQYWLYDPSSGFLRNAANPTQCLDVSGAPGTANGARLGIYHCELSGTDRWGGPTDQRWDYISGFFVNRLSGKCIDVAGAPGAANHLPIWLWDCETSGFNRNGSPTDQRWTSAGLGGAMGTGGMPTGSFGGMATGGMATGGI